MRAITYLIIGTIIGLSGVGFMINHMPLLGAILLIIGVSISLKGRNKLDKDDLSRGPKMTDKKRFVSIILISIFVITLGGWSLFRYGQITLHTLFHFSETANVVGLSWNILIIFYSLVLISFIVGGIALLLLKNWGKVLLCVSLAIDISLRLFGIVRYWYGWFTTERVPIPANSIVGTISMFPTYIILLAEIITLYFITRPNIKEQFK